ncbi:N-acetylmuramoyl-L-alanine amidase [bacterium]|nr:N-acetylmuramoyl-L-alanine amidase [bacterium]
MNFIAKFFKAIFKKKEPKKQYPEKIWLSEQTTGKYAKEITPRAIVLHDTCGNYEGSVDWTRRSHRPSGTRLYASYHCIIARDGRRTITNLDTNRAYHAGKSKFRGKSSLNNWSIGVAFERNSHKEPIQDAAIESAIEYILPRMEKWKIKLGNVVDHRTISPDRKTDLKKSEFQRVKAAIKEALES